MPVLRGRDLVLSLALVALLVVPLDARALPGGGACGGSAPATTSCTTGSHAGYSVNFVSNPTPGPNYTGRLVVKFSWTGGHRTTTCDFPGGGCTTTGSPLPASTPFTHTCNSFNFGTSTPGGSGVWTCALAYA